MARETLPEALRLMFGHEGGYVNNPNDPGGPTKYGITHRTLAAHRGVRSVTAAQVRDLTLSEAEEIYRKSYWMQSGGDLLPRGLDYAAFDFGVNSGPARAIKSLQKIVGVAQDGIVGGQTLNAVENYGGGIRKLIRDYCDERMRFLRALRTWASFGRGWTIRVTGKDPRGQWADQPGVIGNALRMAAGSATRPSDSDVPIEAGKASDADRSVVDIVKNEPSLLVSLLGGLGTIAAGSGPLQWALAIGVVMGVGYGIYRLVRRERANA